MNRNFGEREWNRMGANWKRITLLHELAHAVEAVGAGPDGDYTGRLEDHPLNLRVRDNCAELSR